MVPAQQTTTGTELTHIADLISRVIAHVLLDSRMAFDNNKV